jgi:hypothetical protein
MVGARCAIVAVRLPSAAWRWRRQRFPYMFEFRQGTLLCRVIYYPSLPVSIPIWEPCALGEARAACDYMLQLLEPTS